MKLSKAKKMYSKLMEYTIKLTIKNLNCLYRKMSKAGWPINPGFILSEFQYQLDKEEIIWG
jgi:hypothetical protein